MGFLGIEGELLTRTHRGVERIGESSPDHETRAPMREHLLICRALFSSGLGLSPGKISRIAARRHVARLHAHRRSRQQAQAIDRH